MKTVAVVALLCAVALAGCTEDAPKTYTCKSGTVLQLESVPGHDEEGFDPESACPKPTPPSLAFVGLPASVASYKTIPVQWTALNGSYALGHAMATSVRLSHHSVPDANLTDAASYGREVAKKEHQEIPQTFSGTLRIDAPATVYLRVHGLIRGEGLAETDFWSPEVALVVEPVKATGTTITIAHGPGDFLATVEAPSSVQLGDAIVFDNQDLKEHTFTFAAAPGTKPAAVTVPAGESSTPIVLLVPGNYRIITDDVQPKTIEFNVAIPA